ncbi:MAG: GAG-pre-integrase domain-containing protein [Gloeomargaritales cyanobacterium]
MKWHFRLGHIGFQAVQWLARRKYLPECIANCELPKCASCQYGTAQKRSASTNFTGRSRHPGVKPPRQNFGHIKAGNLRPGDRVSVDH